MFEDGDSWLFDEVGLQLREKVDSLGSSFSCWRKTANNCDRCCSRQLKMLVSSLIEQLGCVAVDCPKMSR